MDLTQVGAVLRNRPLLLANLGYFGHMWELYAMWGWFLAFASAAGEAGNAALAGRASLVTFAVVAAGVPGCVARRLALRPHRPHADHRADDGALRRLRARRSGSSSTARPGRSSLVALVWGVTVVADSAQFSAAVTELADQRFVGTALALQLGLGFGLTVVDALAGAALRRLDRRLALGLPGAGAGPGRSASRRCWRCAGARRRGDGRREAVATG